VTAALLAPAGGTFFRAATLNVKRLLSDIGSGVGQGTSADCQHPAFVDRATISLAWAMTATSASGQPNRSRACNRWIPNFTVVSMLVVSTMLNLLPQPLRRLPWPAVSVCTA
jgi:hypothetical protein